MICGLQQSGRQPTFISLLSPFCSFYSIFLSKDFPFVFFFLYIVEHFFLLACGVLFHCFAFHCIGRSFFIASGGIGCPRQRNWVHIGFCFGNSNRVFRAAGINAVVSTNSFFPSLSLLFASLPLYSCIVLFSLFPPPLSVCSNTQLQGQNTRPVHTCILKCKEGKQSNRGKNRIIRIRAGRW